MKFLYLDTSVPNPGFTKVFVFEQILSQVPTMFHILLLVLHVF